MLDQIKELNKIGNEIENAVKVLKDCKLYEDEGENEDDLELKEREQRDLQIDGAYEARTGEVGKCIS